MTVKRLTEQHLEYLSLKGGCTVSEESILVKMPHCWKSHVAAQLCVLGDLFRTHSTCLGGEIRTLVFDFGLLLRM